MKSKYHPLKNSTIYHKSTNSKTRTNQIIQNQNILFQEKFLNIQNNFPDHHHIYTDGSKVEEKLVVLLFSKTKNC